MSGTPTIVIHDVTTAVNEKVNPVNPDPDDVNACVDTPVGRMCRTLQDLIPIIAGLVGV